MLWVLNPSQTTIATGKGPKVHNTAEQLRLTQLHHIICNIQTKKIVTVFKVKSDPVNCPWYVKPINSFRCSCRELEFQSVRLPRCSAAGADYPVLGSQKTKENKEHRNCTFASQGKGTGVWRTTRLEKSYVLTYSQLEHGERPGRRLDGRVIKMLLTYVAPNVGSLECIEAPAVHGQLEAKLPNSPPGNTVSLCQAAGCAASLSMRAPQSNSASSDMNEGSLEREGQLLGSSWPWGFLGVLGCIGTHEIGTIGTPRSLPTAHLPIQTRARELASICHFLLAGPDGPLNALHGSFLQVICMCPHISPWLNPATPVTSRIPETNTE